jgi:ribose 1,5-bisphosphokinase PhnN
MPAMVVAGPFGTGKRQLLQRMLALYPKGFCLPPVYTTKSDAGGGNLQTVTQDELSDLRRKKLLVYEEVIVGETYAVSLLDVRRCA